VAALIGTLAISIAGGAPSQKIGISSPTTSKRRRIKSPEDRKPQFYNLRCGHRLISRNSLIWWRCATHYNQPLLTQGGENGLAEGSFGSRLRVLACLASENASARREIRQEKLTKSAPSGLQYCFLSGGKAKQGSKTHR
jgi:hypothetical protein